MDFRRYDHLEKLGRPEVEGIDVGRVHVFPKLDGTNASTWLGAAYTENAVVRCGSRNRALSAEKDNAGFHAWVHGDDGCAPSLRAALEKFGGPWVIYGEWLVPHTFKAYREEAWRRFWIFDVFDRVQEKYVPYEAYAGAFEEFSLDVIEPRAIITNPSAEQLLGLMETNTYLVEDGAGPGEGLTLKNYDWTNRFGKQPWAKLVRTEFKEKNAKAFGVPVFDGGFHVEAAIAEECVTATLVNKTRAKIMLELANEQKVVIDPGDPGGYVIDRAVRKTLIPRLLQTVFHEVVTEEIWTVVRKHKDPTINFKRLRQHVAIETKLHAKDLF